MTANVLGTALHPFTARTNRSVEITMSGALGSYAARGLRQVPTSADGYVGQWMR